MAFLSEEQQALVDTPGNTFVEACPGAGKTRAIVARFMKRAEQEPRNGIALLSFTNAAIDEARARCGGVPHLLRSPHFIGTFDSFINRLVTSPVYVAAHRRAPYFVEDWAKFERTGIRTTDMSNGLEVPLDSFDFDDQGKGRLEDDRVPRNYNLQAEAKTYREVLERIASTRLNSYVSGGTFACSASRWYARRALAHPLTGPTVLKLLAARFAEVIVDEGQDSDPDELAILAALSKAGVPLVMVADLDQSIFEFRRCDPEAVRTFANTLKQGTRLSGNYRSSAAICQITSSLRVSDNADVAVGSNADCDVPLIVLDYRTADALPAVITEIAASHGLGARELVVLAHAGRDAAQAAGREVRDAGGAKISQIARAAVTIRTPSATVREKRTALLVVERILLNLLDDVSVAGMPLERACENAGIPRRWLQTSAGRVAASFEPREHERTAYAAAVRNWIARLRWPNDLKTSQLGHALKAPNEDKWFAAVGTPSDASLIPGTVHSYKGKESSAVALVLPRTLRKDEDRTVLDRWEGGEDSEARRVLYVGASRAKRLLILAAHKSYVSRIEKVLDRDGVIYERRTV